VSVDGELFTWGDNARGCAGHPAHLFPFLTVPTKVTCMYTRPLNMARSTEHLVCATQSSVFSGYGVSIDIDIYLYLSISISIDIDIYLSINLSIYLSFYIYLNRYLNLYLYLYRYRYRYLDRWTEGRHFNLSILFVSFEWTHTKEDMPALTMILLRLRRRKDIPFLTNGISCARSFLTNGISCARPMTRSYRVLLMMLWYVMIWYDMIYIYIYIYILLLSVVFFSETNIFMSKLKIK
jgi:hypothetical protein